MKAQDNFSKKGSVNFVVIILFLLPGCGDWDGKKKSEPTVKKQATEKKPLTGDVLVSWQEDTTEGVPLITTDSLQVEKEKLLKAQPQLKAMMPFMGKQLERNLSEGLLNQALVDRYIQDHEIDKSSEYQAELKEAYKMLGHLLNTKFFNQEFPAQITDAEVSDFYEKNKDIIPDLVISRGGIEAIGVMFDNEKMANEFMREVKEEKDLQKAAQKTGLADKIKDFKLVNSQSIGIEVPLREKIVKMKKVPATELFKIDDKTFWVVYASKKEESKYRPLEQIKDNIKQLLVKEKQSEKYEQEMSKLKKEYKVVINEDYFKSEEEPAGVMAGQQKESKNEVPTQKKINNNNKSKVNKKVVQEKHSVSGAQIV